MAVLRYGTKHRKSPDSKNTLLVAKMQAASCSLGEPLALSTFALPSTGVPKANHVSHVLGSYTSVPRNEEGWLTLTCQGDGVHIVDVRAYMSPRTTQFTNLVIAI